MEHASVPASTGPVARAIHPVSGLEQESRWGGLDRRVRSCEPLAVLVPPGAQRGDLQARLTREDPMYDADRADAVRHRQLDLQEHRAEVVAPPGYAVIEVECREVLMPPRIEGTAGPLVGG